MKIDKIILIIILILNILMFAIGITVAFEFFILFICVLLMIYKRLLINKSFISDKVMLIQLLIIIIFLIEYFIADNTEYFWGNFGTFIIANIIYFTVKNISIKNINCIFEKFVNIISIILLFTIFQKSIELLIVKQISFSGYYKLLFEIPIGSSNNIGMYVVFLFNLIIYRKNNKILNKIFLILLYLAAFLIYSRTTIILVNLSIIFYIIKKDSGEFILKGIKILLFCLLGALIISFVNKDFIIKLIKGVGSYSDFTINNLSSGRIGIYADIFNQTNVKNFLWGNGIGNIYIDGHPMRAHNFILDLFAWGGIFVVILYLILIYIIIKELKKYIIFKNIKAIYFASIIYFLQALIEPVMFVYGNDTFFWTIISMGMLIIKSKVIDNDRRFKSENLNI